MHQAQREQLKRYVEAADRLDSRVDMERWAERVVAFFKASLEAEEACVFAGLINPIEVDCFKVLALLVGHLEGLVANGEAIGTISQNESLSVESRPDSTIPNARRIFIVHGHDSAAKDTVARFLSNLELEPVILHEQVSEGRTIIEKFEVYSGDVGYAVIILTPDDVGSQAGDQRNLRKRARQNVVLELGYFMGRLGRTRVCALCEESVELPSDYQGVVYIQYDKSGAWKQKMAQELMHAKICLKLEGLLRT